MLNELKEIREALDFYADVTKYKTPLADENCLNIRGEPYPDKGRYARRVLTKVDAIIQRLESPELVREMVDAYDTEICRCINCDICKGTGIIRIGHDPEYCDCGGGQIFPATDTSCMEAVVNVIKEPNKSVTK